MKLNRRALYIILTLVFVAILFNQYRGYTGKVKARGGAIADIATAQARVPILLAERTTLAQQLTQTDNQTADVTAQLNKTKAAYSKGVESIESDAKFFELADATNVKISSLFASDPGTEQLDKVNYTVMSFSMVIEGQLADVLNFIGRMATSENFTTATINSVSFSIPAPLTALQKLKMTPAQIQDAGKLSAAIAVAMYGRKE